MSAPIRNTDSLDLDVWLAGTWLYGALTAVRDDLPEHLRDIADQALARYDKAHAARYPNPANKEAE